MNGLMVANMDFQKEHTNTNEEDPQVAFSALFAEYVSHKGINITPLPADFLPKALAKKPVVPGTRPLHVLSPNSPKCIFPVIL